MSRRDRYGDEIEDDDEPTPADTTRHLISLPKPIVHSPNCGHPGVTTTPGHSVDITTCTGCGALTTTRRRTP